MRELATAVYLAFNEPEKIDEVFREPTPRRPEYEEPTYWGPNAREGEAA
jgi:hypothetical protein